MNFFIMMNGNKIEKESMKKNSADPFILNNSFIHLSTLGLIFLIGFGLRLKLFIYNPSFFCDESALVLNVINRSFPELFQGLDHMQVAPPLFLVTAKILYNLLYAGDDLYARDLIFRTFPFVCSVVSIPIFIYFVNLLFKNKQLTILSSFIFVLNPVLIDYSSEFKQYSCETIFALLLLIIFYSFEKYNFIKSVLAVFIICLAPWFSISSWFIIAAGCLWLIYLYITNKPDSASGRKVLFLCFAVFVNFIFYIKYYLISTYMQNYAGMNEFWNETFRIYNPLFFFQKTGELFFARMMPVNIILGFVVVCLFIFYLVKEKDCKRKWFLTVPVFLVLLATLLHFYLFERRLVLFLIPAFSIIICYPFTLTSGKKFKLILAALFLTGVSAFFIPAGNFVINKNAARDLMLDLRQNIRPGDKIIAGPSIQSWEYYSGKLPAYMFLDQKFSSGDKMKLEQLKAGHYYIYIAYNYHFIKQSNTGYTNPALTDYVKNNPDKFRIIKIYEYPDSRKTNLIYFEKK
jgi:hypothetical protein